MQQGTDIATGAHYPRQYKVEAYKMEVTNVHDAGHNTLIKNDARSYGRHEVQFFDKGNVCISGCR